MSIDMMPPFYLSAGSGLHDAITDAPLFLETTNSNTSKRAIISLTYSSSR